MIKTSKSERKEKTKELIRSFAEKHNHPLDIDDPDSLRSILFVLLEKMGLQPEINENKSIKALNIDDNGYNTNHYYSYQFKRQTINSTLKRLINFFENGVIAEIGDLTHLRITDVSRNILEIAIGENWKNEVSDKIREKYGHVTSGYVPVAKYVSVKLVEREIMVQADFGRVRYRNHHVVIPGMGLPDSLKVIMENIKVGDIVEGLPYPLLSEAKAQKIEQMPGQNKSPTLIIIIDKNPNPV